MSDSVPKLEVYFPSEKNLTVSQKKFYQEVTASLDRDKYIALDGNISYAFLYIYQLIDRWDKVGFDYLNERLISLSQIFAYEKKLSDYCVYWANDCLLGSGKFEEHLRKTAPKDTLHQSCRLHNLRLNLQYHLGLQAEPLDLLLMCKSKRSKFVRENQALYLRILTEAFEKYARPFGGWFELFKEWGSYNPIYPSYLFEGVPLSAEKMPELPFKISCFYSAYEKCEIIPQLAKEAEIQAKLLREE